MKDIMLPTIHLNGTSLAALAEANDRAHYALLTAIAKLAEAAPNGRDYYPQSPEALYKAQDEHWDRINRLQSVTKELEQIGEYLAMEEARRKR